jgi:hypothetical protein
MRVCAAKLGLGCIGEVALDGVMQGVDAGSVSGLEQSVLWLLLHFPCPDSAKWQIKSSHHQFTVTIAPNQLICSYVFRGVLLFLASVQGQHTADRA